MTDDIQKRRNAIEIQAALLNEQTKGAVENVFALQLVTYMEHFLNPGMSDAQALEIRFRALGVMETLEGLGAEFRKLMDGPVKAAATRAVKRAVNDTGPTPWSS